MKKFYLLCFFFILTICLQAQNNLFESFNRLEPEGEMPEYFRTVLQKKDINQHTYTNDLELLEEKIIFSLLMNGKILYGDPVTQYLNLLLTKILEQKPEWQNEVQIYALKSEQVNAFSTPKGTIFVNLGLIAHCNSEAELVFIICHELAHYEKSHIEDKLKMDPDKIKNMDDFLKYHSQTRELELNADKYGFLDFYKDLGYNYDVYEDVFDMLLFANLPFGEKMFTRNFFENEYYQFDDSYFLSQTNQVTSRENYVDTLSSHPNILNRRLEMRKLVKQFSNNHTTTTCFDNQFKEARLLAQFETINQMIINNNYLTAYYNSCALQDIYPKHNFLQQTEAAALYALCRLKVTDNYQKNVIKSSKMYGEIQFPTYLLEKMNKKELTVWTLRTIWKALKTNPSNDYLTQIFNDMVKQVMATIGSLNQFCDYRMTDTLIVEQKLDTTTSNRGKYERYKEKVKVAPSPNFNVENYMLADLKNDSHFLETFELGILSAEKAEVNRFILKYKNRSKEKTPIIIFQPTLEWRGISKSEKKKQNQIIIFEKDCKKMANSYGFSPQLISSIYYPEDYSYSQYVRSLELERNINSIIPLAYETRQADEMCKALETSYINYITLTKTKTRTRYNASLTFVLYDLKNKKYLYNTMRNIKISDKSEFYQTLYENYSGARKNIKQ